VVRVRLASQVTVNSATVLALVDSVPSPAVDSVLRAAFKVAASLGYGLEVYRLWFLQRVTDPRHGALYQVSANTEAGYLLVRPGRRPRTIRGLIDATSLAAAISEYELGVTSPLATGAGPTVPPNWRLELAGAATTFRLCAKERSMKQTAQRCAKDRRARSSSAVR
jgi:hypothetical protein